MKYLAIMIGLCLLTGCQQTRSFLQMDSNSSAPFLGLELSVDAKDAASGNQLSGRLTQNQLAARNVSHQITQPSVTAPDGDRSASDDAMVEYSLPMVRMDANPGEAAEVQEILSRLAGS